MPTEARATIKNYHKCLWKFFEYLLFAVKLNKGWGIGSAGSFQQAPTCLHVDSLSNPLATWRDFFQRTLVEPVLCTSKHLRAMHYTFQRKQCENTSSNMFLLRFEFCAELLLGFLDGVVNLYRALEVPNPHWNFPNDFKCVCLFMWGELTRGLECLFVLSVSSDSWQRRRARCSQIYDSQGRGKETKCRKNWRWCQAMLRCMWLRLKNGYM